MIWSKVLFFMMFPFIWLGGASFLLVIPLAAAVSLYCVCLFSSFFRCAFILSRANHQCHATVVTSFVKSSANLEKVTTYEKRTTIGVKKGTELLLSALGKTEIIRLYGLRRENYLRLGLPNMNARTIATMPITTSAHPPNRISQVVELMGENSTMKPATIDSSA